MEVKVSVIMPVYNVEKYLSKSIESLLCQTLKEIEIILVNDGSRDKSKIICEKYSEKDSRVKVINKINEGACIARNIGLDLAKGKYIKFVDADDYFDLNMLEEEYNLAEKSSADVVMSGLKYDIYKKNNKIQFKEAYYKNLTLSSKDDINKIFMDLFDNLLFNYTHNKLYKLSYLKKNDVRFIEWLTIDQDTNFNIDVFVNLNNLTISTKSYYHYVKRNEETIVNRYHANKFKVRTFRYERLYKYLIDNNIYTSQNAAKLSNIYIGQVIEYFDSYSHINCPLKVKEMLNDISMIVESLHVHETLKYNNCFNSFYYNVQYFLIRNKAIKSILLIQKIKSLIVKMGAYYYGKC